MKVYKLLLSLLLTVIATALFAQGGPGAPPPPPPAAPIDAGLFLLLGAGMLYGSYKMYKK